MLKYEDKKDLCGFTKINTNTWSGIKDNVYFRLMNSKYLDEYSKDILQFKFLDLSCVISVQETVDDKIYSHLLTENDIKELNVDKDEVYEIARNNTKWNRKKRVFSLRESLLSGSMLYPFLSIPNTSSIGSVSEGKAPGVINDIDEDGNENILVIRNKNNNFGSVYMVIPEVLDEVYDRFSDNFYILPMSIHEVWCVKSKFACRNNKPLKEAEDDLIDLIEEFNDTQNKTWKDILSYKLYYYFGDDGKKVVSIS